MDIPTSNSGSDGLNMLPESTKQNKGGRPALERIADMSVASMTPANAVDTHAPGPHTSVQLAPGVDESSHEYNGVADGVGGCDGVTDGVGV